MPQTRMPSNYENNYHYNDNEDTVQCFLFSPSLDTEQQSWDQLCNNINSNIKSLSEEYLWHKDEFKVFLPITEINSEDIPPHLASCTSFGDNIEDEWFIVHIILEITRLHKDLIVQIKDNDGDFLLIEAADYLPPWANPDTTENRVFVYNNHIHLIPPQIASLDENIELKDAIQFIFKSSEQTQASADIEQAILKRVGKYPDKIKEIFHNAQLKLPLEIAALLKLKPNLIAPIVDAYCHHDVIDAKGFNNMSINDWTIIPVKFTKCLYAMLLYSKLANTIRRPVAKDKKSILGLKLACGYQIIMKKSSDIYSSKEYFKFLNSLKANGYFKNYIEGSQDYKILLQNAKDFFSAVECPIASSVSNDIKKIMSTDEFSKAKELLKNESVITESSFQEDNDDWLTIHPEQLNELLNSRYGKKTKFQKGDVVTPQTITAELKDFLKQSSDFEGIETHKKDPMDDIIDFDADQFENCIEKMLNLLSTNNDNEEMDSLNSDFDDGMSQSDDDDELDKELKERLHGAAEHLSDNKTILENMVRSMKEEKASVGPSSNLMSNVGLNKTDFLDCDDDD